MARSQCGWCVKMIMSLHSLGQATESLHLPGGKRKEKIITSLFFLYYITILEKDRYLVSFSNFKFSIDKYIYIYDK